MSENLLIDTVINVRETFEKIAEAAKAAGRDPSEIRLMAVTKTVSPDKINEAIDAGCDLLGENRVQELLEKYEFYDKSASRIPARCRRDPRFRTAEVGQCHGRKSSGAARLYAGPAQLCGGTGVVDALSRRPPPYALFFK